MPSAPSAPSPDLSDLKRKSVRGGMVTMLAQGISVAIQLASTVTLARLLSPDDYGVMAMVLAITSFAGLFRDLGLSAAAIQKGTLNQAQMSNLFWLNVGMGSLLTVALAAASPLVAWFYGKPELVPLTLLLSSTFLISSLGTQHGALMQRELQFGRRAITGITGSLVTLAVSILLALRGHGYWALAWGNIAGSITTTILLFTLSSFRPCLWRKGAGIRSMLGFGANVTIFDFVNYFARNLDNILIGRIWGNGPLGLYSRAYQLLMFPINNLRGPLLQVTFPALSRLQNEPASFRNYYLSALSTISFLSMPTVGLLYSVSDPLVKIALGSQWDGVSSLFEILAITAFIQTPLSLNGTIQLAAGRSRRYFLMGTVSAVIVSAGFLVGVRWGPAGVAVAYAVTTYLLLVPMLFWAYQQTSIRVRDFFFKISIPCITTLIGVLFSKITLHFIGGVDPVLQLTIGMISFIAVAAPCSLFSKDLRGHLRALVLSLLTMARSCKGQHVRIHQK